MCNILEDKLQDWAGWIFKCSVLLIEYRQCKLQWAILWDRHHEVWCNIPQICGALQLLEGKRKCTGKSVLDLVSWLLGKLEPYSLAVGSNSLHAQHWHWFVSMFHLNHLHFKYMWLDAICILHYRFSGLIDILYIV